jgi:DNA adenine methylase
MGVDRVMEIQFAVTEDSPAVGKEVEMSLKPPFPYFGGKSRVADIVWPRLNGDGAGHMYIEPFFGSGAILLASEPFAIETVNDIDGMVANFWRAVQRDPDSVADHAIWPCNELDLHARGDWLIGKREPMTELLRSDPDYCDVKAAGWWAWGMAWWIGSGWAMPTSDGCVGEKRPHLGDPRGVGRPRPHLSNSGQGLARKLPHLGDASEDLMDRNGTREYLRALALRLRYVRVCCGDWSRILTAGAMAHGVGKVKCVFLDPPYSKAIRDPACYNIDTDPSAAVGAWCREHQDDPTMRICLAGYEGEHDMPGWDVVEYKNNASYSTAKSCKSGEGNAKNRHLERLWFSPSCCAVNQSKQPILFEELDDNLSD